MKFIKGIAGEFKEFIMRGNVLDMAVGVLIGASFQAIVKSLVDDVISPLIGCLGGADFSKYSITLKAATDTTEAVVLSYGNFINSIINFFLMALCIFIIVKVCNVVRDKMSKKEEIVEEATTKVCPFCKSEIALDATRCPHCTSQLED